MDQDHEFSSLWGGEKIVNWFPKLLESQVDFIANTITSIFTTTFTTQTFPFSLPNHPKLQQPHATTDATTRTSSDIASMTQQVVKRVGQGLLGAMYAGMVLSFVMIVSLVTGVGLVNHWVEEPIVVKHNLYFDYTDVNPEALFLFSDVNAGIINNKHDHKVGAGVPVGHTFYVSLTLLVPDSDYNRDIGIFQIMAEVISTNGKVIARSSQPSMLRFQSHPIRLMRTFAMSLPLMVGLTRETQKIKIPLLNYKEDSKLRTGAIKITLMPRAGTSYLPQLYEAEIQMHSKLPRVKELVHNWKWTFYVWASSYIYIMLVVLLICFFKPLLVFPILKSSTSTNGRRLDSIEGEETAKMKMPEEREFSESLRKWQHYRRKRKAELLSKNLPVDDSAMSAATSYTLTKDDMGSVIIQEEEIADSESICKGSCESDEIQNG